MCCNTVESGKVRVNENGKRMGTIYFITSSSEAHAMHGHKEHKLILHLIYCVGILRQNKRRETREVLGAGDCFDFEFRRL